MISRVSTNCIACTIMIHFHWFHECSTIYIISVIPLVSIDFNHNANSSTFDMTQTQVIESRFCRVLSWYDNEWGFSNRMLDTAATLGKLG